MAVAALDEEARPDADGGPRRWPTRRRARGGRLLFTSFRNDGLAPDDPDGHATFGDREWRDLQAWSDRAQAAGADVPALLVHDPADATVPGDPTVKLADQLGDRAEMVQPDGVGHVGWARADGADHRGRVRRFLDDVEADG